MLTSSLRDSFSIGIKKYKTSDKLKNKRSKLEVRKVKI
jgi:hypothetical protein